MTTSQRGHEYSPGGSAELTVNPTDLADDGMRYEPPVVVDLGSVRDVTLGSSTSGTADANSQYYW
ncbi:lasso RiPP family leader peptide-containing protein [Streptomyces sp. NBC_01506]|uniref:lasso RiPP family leader peptide-containing protein n=1 Tax=Streptomyces sp. NBC_01506 TaxID=2903887 RepID=UPI00386A6C77